MDRSHILITGATGFIGFHVLLSVLQDGHRVICTVRKAEQIEYLTSIPALKSTNASDRLDFSVVSDLTAAGAYDSILPQITHIIHVASPLPQVTEDYIKDIVNPCLHSTTTVLNSALKFPQIQRIVITSSVTANLPFEPTPGTHVTANTRAPNKPPPYQTPKQAYNAGKAYALNATDEFVAKHKPHFAITNIFPGYVFGRDERADKPDTLLAGSNAMIPGILVGWKPPTPRLAASAHINDVALVHLLALKEPLQASSDNTAQPPAGGPENNKYTGYGVSIPVKDTQIFEIVREAFPKAVADGVLTEGQPENYEEVWDARATEERFGIKFKGQKEMVIDVVGQYLELSGKEKA